MYVHVLAKGCTPRKETKQVGCISPLSMKNTPNYIAMLTTSLGTFAKTEAACERLSGTVLH